MRLKLKHVHARGARLQVHMARHSTLRQCDVTHSVYVALAIEFEGVFYGAKAKG